MKRGFLALICGIGFAGMLAMGPAGARAAAGAITVSVHEQPGDKPIAGVKVTMRMGSSRGDYYTGDDGNVELPNTGKASYISIQAAEEGYAPVTLFWNKRVASDQMPDHFNLTLEKAAPISGMVVDQKGDPLPGAKVVLTIEKKYANGQRLSANWTTVTADAMGNWSFGGAPETFDKIELAAYHRECIAIDGMYAMQAYGDLAALRNGTATLKLTRGTPVTVVVTDQDGQPIKGARIAYGEQRQVVNAYPEEKTNSRGVCALGIQSGATAVLTIQSKTYAPELVRVPVGDTAQTLNIKLEPGHTLEGTVVDSDGNPATNASVYIQSWRGVQTINKRLPVDAEGHFVWNEAPADEVKCSVSARSGQRNDVALKAGQENKVALQPPTSFKGTVVDAATGQPITKYSLALGIWWGSNQPIYWQYDQQTGAAGGQEVQRSAENFEVTFTYPYPGHAVRVAADGYYPTDSAVFPSDGKEVAFTFKMQKGEPIAGTVLGVDGKPAAGAKVALVMPGQGLQIENGALQEWSSRIAIQAAAGADGKFSLPPQREDYLLLALSDAGFAQVDKAAFAKGATLTLQAWGRIEGTVHHGTKVGPGESVQGWKTQEMGPWNANVPRVNFYYSAATDDAGKFALDRVAPGTYMVGLSVRMGRFGTTINQTSVEVAAGKTEQVEIGGKGRPVTGRIELPAEMASQGHQFMQGTIQPSQAGEVAGAAWHYLLGSPSRARRPAAMIAFVINADGTFKAEGITEGQYTVNVPIFATSNDNGGWGPQIGHVAGAFTMPAIPGGVSDEALDIGVLKAVAH